MGIKNSVLVVMIIILIVIIVIMKRNGGNPLLATGGESMRAAPRKSPERGALMENAQYFTACADTHSTDTLDSNSGGCSGDYSYAVNEFGAKGMTYKDWVTSQAVDPQVIKNHAEFVRDRSQGGPQNITGRTYSPDSNDSYDPQPWMGIRGRPQAVSVCNPDQVSDMDYDLFPNKAKLSWNSGESQ